MNRLAVTVLTTLTMILTFMGLTNLLAAGPWQIHMVVMPVVIVGAMAAVSALLRRHLGWGALASTVAGVIVYACYLCYAVTGSILPAPTIVQAVWAHVDAGILALPDYGRPASNPDLFVGLGLLGLGPMCVAAGYLALGARRPLWVGVPAAACWAVFLVGSPQLGVGWIVATAVAYLLLVAVSPKGEHVLRRFQPSSVVVVALAGVVGVLASFVAPLVPGWGISENWDGPFAGSYVDRTGVTVEGTIEVGDQLHSSASVILFHTQGEQNGPLKVGSLYAFDGQHWSNPSTTTPWRLTDTWSAPYVGGLMWDLTDTSETGMYPGAVVAPGPQWSDGAPVTVTIDQMTGHVLPTTTGPRDVTGAPRLSLVYNQITDALYSQQELVSGDAYVTSAMVLDRRTLVGLPVTSMGGMRSPYQGVTHMAQIESLTRQIVGAAASEDAQLMAIQSYLRSSPFVYTLRPHWASTGDPVWDFLTAKQGYCVQYATAMAVMASSIGISMRVSVGYMPGQPQSNGVRVVTGAQAHMWPEAFYAGIGWVRYEPTPAMDSPGAGVVTPTPTVSATPTPSVAPSATTSHEAPTTQPGQTATTAPTATTSTWSRLWPWAARIGGVLVGAGAVALVVWLIRMMSSTPERAWRRILRAALRAGLVAQGMSVRTCAGILAGRIPDLASGLDELRQTLEARRYGPPGTTSAPAPTRYRLWRLAHRVVTQMTGTKPGS
ncbi:MAG: DUF3488 and transglutaminase-like domain-containing protein [Propionibacteriaceae bacterium]|nr:DUF3488 and transglutaminase-like domain-containing protein [Propionibacteriaceae bacterium]